MFNLNQAISEWRGNLASRGACTASDLDELESHLRDEVDSLERSGLTPEEAFLIAVRRLGDNGTIAHEFAKINKGNIWGRRLLWMAAGVLGYLCLRAAVNCVTGLFVCGVTFVGLRGYGLGILEIATKAFVTFGVMALLSVMIRSGSHSLESRLTGIVENKFGRLTILYGIPFTCALLSLVQVGEPLYLSKQISPQSYGSLIMITAAGRLTWSLLLPFLLAFAIIALHRRNKRETSV